MRWISGKVFLAAKRPSVNVRCNGHEFTAFTRSIYVQSIHSFFLKKKQKFSNLIELSCITSTWIWIWMKLTCWMELLAKTFTDFNVSSCVRDWFYLPKKEEVRERERRRIREGGERERRRWAGLSPAQMKQLGLIKGVAALATLSSGPVEGLCSPVSSCAVDLLQKFSPTSFSEWTVKMSVVWPAVRTRQFVDNFIHLPSSPSVHRRHEWFIQRSDDAVFYSKFRRHSMAGMRGMRADCHHFFWPLVNNFHFLRPAADDTKTE